MSRKGHVVERPASAGFCVPVLLKIKPIPMAQPDEVAETNAERLLNLGFLKKNNLLTQAFLANPDVDLEAEYEALLQEEERAKAAGEEKYQSWLRSSTRTFIQTSEDFGRALKEHGIDAKQVDQPPQDDENNEFGIRFVRKQPPPSKE